MLRIHFAGMITTVIASALTAPAQAQQPAPPPFATTKVTDNVYIFRYGNHHHTTWIGLDRRRGGSRLRGKKRLPFPS